MDSNTPEKDTRTSLEMWRDFALLQVQHVNAQHAFIKALFERCDGLETRLALATLGSPESPGKRP